MKPYRPKQKLFTKYNPCQCAGCCGYGSKPKGYKNPAKKAVRRQAKEQIRRALDE